MQRTSHSFLSRGFEPPVIHFGSDWFSYLSDPTVENDTILHTLDEQLLLSPEWGSTLIQQTLSYGLWLSRLMPTRLHLVRQLGTARLGVDYSGLLWAASENGSIESIEYAYQLDPAGLSESHGVMEMPILHASALRDDSLAPLAIRCLLGLGANPQSICKAGRNALFRALCFDCVQLLIDSGADPFAPDQQGITAFSHWLSFGLLDCALYALKKYPHQASQRFIFQHPASPSSELQCALPACIFFYCAPKEDQVSSAMIQPLERLAEAGCEFLPAPDDELHCWDRALGTPAQGILEAQVLDVHLLSPAHPSILLNPTFAL